MGNQVTGISRREFMRRAGITAAGAGGVLIAESIFVKGIELFAAPKPPPAGQVQLPGNKIPQFVDPLPVLDIGALNGQSTTGISTIVAGTSEIRLNMKTFQAKIMPSTFVPAAGGAYTGTWTFGYLVDTPNAAPLYETPVGPVIVATRNQPTQIRYINNLEASANTIHWRDWTDQTLHSAFHQAVGMGMPPMPPDPMAAAHYMGPVLAVPHLHGGEVPAVIDGGPEAWFASNVAGPSQITVNQGPAYYAGYDQVGGGATPAAPNEAIYRYPNTQEAAPLWFHDHLLGGTRLNATFAGLAGAYALIDPALTLPTGMNPIGLNNGAVDLSGIGLPTNVEPLIPLVIQDRMFDTNGQLFFPTVGVNPEHPWWVPEFVGDTIIVNGKVWPYLNVDRKRYRFYVINGSNSRGYDMFLQNLTNGGKGPSIWVIATDGGYLDAPVEINPNATGRQIMAGAQKSLMMMPGERYEIIIDFSGVPAGSVLTLRNLAPTVNGNPKASTEGRIMQFRVSANAPVDASYNPATLVPIRTGTNAPLFDNQKIKRLVNPLTGISTTSPALTRFLTLNEIVGAGGPLEALVNNSKWGGTNRPDFTLVAPNYLSEFPNEGATEIWEIANLTMDSHPIHLHAIQFQLMNRQPFNMTAWMAVYMAAFPGSAMIDPMTGMAYPPGMFIPGFGPPLPYDQLDATTAFKYGGNPDVTPFLLGLPIPPLPHEAGWKDTVIMHPGEVTRIVARWAPQDTPVGSTGSFSFKPDAPINPGASPVDQIPGVYVWHCHITDHEDNEMMRPDVVVSSVPDASRTYIQGTHY
ncbi:MAG: multicopper oxidase domain-containing protein [Dehalogenimonas sp.]